ncbi:MAG: flagellar basal body L-ring protein FlgH [Alphaproteobacteria bacterium]
MTSPRTIILLASVSLLLAGCNTADRLANVGKTPSLSSIEDPTASTDYKPVRMPMPDPVAVSHAPNSLWQQGSRSFFKDQRARQVGDLVTVKVNFKDSADIANETKRARSNSENMGVPNLFGLEAKTQTAFAGADQNKLVGASSTSASDGSGSVKRAETLATNVAAVVTQILPNGNMVIEGKQEVRVNFEIRELIVAGIIRPEDIEADNTVESMKIAEARIAYGGRGQITDVQQPRYGQQVMDIVLPF